MSRAILFISNFLVCMVFSCVSVNEPSDAKGQQDQDLAITFHDDVAPIIFTNCTPCHRPGQAGPFPFTSYEEVAKHSRMIRYVVGAKYMPPWPANKSYRHFIGERSLDENEINTIKNWIDQGSVEGNKKQTNSLPDFAANSQFGKPDLVLKFADAVKIKGDGIDQFLTLSIPYEIAQDTFIKLIEFVPDNRELVHHVNSHLIAFDETKKTNHLQGEKQVDAYKFNSRIELYSHLNLLNDDSSYPEIIPLVCNYLPGVSPAIYPEGIGGYPMAKKGALVLNDIHYGPSGIDTTDNSYFNIFYAPKAPQRPTLELQMGTLGISPVIPDLVIPADSIKHFRSEAQILNDISLLTINPHMHLLGKTFRAFSISPNNDTIPLIDIPKWNFRWQYFYTFERPIKLIKGSRIHVHASFDNTSKNPNNPYDPPRVITARDGSMKTTDEMLQFIMTFIPYEEGDERIQLDRAIR